MNSGLTIEGYPTYYLFIPSEEVMKIERYNGSRTVEDRKRFLKTYVCLFDSLCNIFNIYYVR